MRLERYPTPHLIPGRAGARPRAIVVHTTQGTFDGTVDWFERPESGVSAHYLVGLDGRVGAFVDEADAARHVGGAARGGDDPNLWTIGIEFEDGGDPTAPRTDHQYRVGARLIREIAQRWGFPADEEHVVGHRVLDGRRACPGSLEPGRLIREANEPGAVLVCLLPVRNGEQDLPGYLESAARFADAVVALDDGSTDGSRAILEAHPLVKIVLANPPRPTYEGWDDAANRNRLLEAAVQLDPAWVLFLDADERIAADDAAALRSFVERDALPGCAYGLQHLRVWGDRFEPEARLVYRLFEFQPAARIASGRLHFDPVPSSIPRSRWLPTTIRLQHLGARDSRRMAQRAAKYREADPAGSDALGEDGLAELPSGPQPWTPRPAGLSVLADRDSSTVERAGTPLICLLPVRNGEQDLPGYLESAARFTDAVVALDDGSTDGSRAILEAHPLVKIVLANPPRPTYEGWDDAANRNRLLEAAVQLDPAWVLFLDADERIDPSDASALRRFVEEDALPGCAYMFRVHRMVGVDRYDRADLWVARLFSFAPDHRLEGSALHLVPVPSAIPPSRWIRTTLRIQHFAGATEEQRRARVRKHLQADPDHRFQRSYRRLADRPGLTTVWRARDEDEAVVPAGRSRRGGVTDLGGPVLSAIVIARNDERTIELSVRSVVAQDVPEPFEVVVVTSGSDRTAAIVRERFPEVTVIELDDPALPGRARNAGLTVARGDYVSFPGSHVELPPGSLAARVRAHERGSAMVTGSVRNGTHTLSGWASYFLDHSGSLPGRPSGPLAAPPAHCSYARDFLIEVGGFPEDLRAGEDTVVNHRLYRQGYRAHRAAEVQLWHRSPCRRPWQLVTHHFRRGRAMTRILRADADLAQPLLSEGASRRVLMSYVPDRLRRTSVNVRRWGGDLRSVYRRSFPLVFAGTMAAWAGAWFELAVESVRSPGSRSPETSPKQRRPFPGAAVPGI